MEICQVTVSITTAGSAGSATGTGVTPVLHGFLLDISPDWHASAPATSDLTIAYPETARGNIIVISNSSTDAFHAPRKNLSDNAGAAISGAYDLYALNGGLSLSVAGCDALSGAVAVTIRYLRIA